MLWAALLLLSSDPCVQELARQADIFEQNAHRVAGIETFKQVVPTGIRTTTNQRGTQVRLPGHTREIVSEYGLVPEDVRGGSLREARMVLTVDGLRWKKGTRDLTALSKELARSTRKSLEDMEDFGLSGFITDVGQLILLFGRGNVSQFEFTPAGGDEDAVVYRYQQRAGPAAFTIYGESKEEKKERLRGQVWFRMEDRLPVRISLESERKDEHGLLKDVVTVSYFLSPFGTLLPVRILHEQRGDDVLLVTNEFLYSNYKRVLPASRRK